MKTAGIKLISLVVGLGLALPMAASAATLVKVELWDKGAMVEMPTDFAYGAKGLDLSKAPMGIKLSTASVRTGSVTFDVTNSSKDTVHEMVVIQLTAPDKPLPYDKSASKVIEDKTIHKGEVSELEPGKSGSLTVNLKPGKYLLICNIPFHHTAGMWTAFTVTK
jgi:uncharacterized cupredoxin-like copper-binding protein